MSVVKYDRPWAIRDAAGNVVYESGAFVQDIEDVKITNAAIGGASGQNAVLRGEAVVIDATNCNLPRWDYATTGVDVSFAGVVPSGGTVASPLVLAGKRVSAATDKCYLGVALENIRTGETGRIVTDGISAVKCLTVASLTAGTVQGSAIIGSATAGAVDGAGAITVFPSNSLSLGTIAVLAGVTAGLSGSLTQLITRINPH